MISCIFIIIGLACAMDQQVLMQGWAGASTSDDTVTVCPTSENGENFFLITRLWELQCPSSIYTTPEVVDSFKCGFAPLVRSNIDFFQYVGAVVDIEKTFFYNIIKTAESAMQVQQQAKDFVDATILKNQIKPVVPDGAKNGVTAFTEGKLLFLLTKSEKCTQQNNAGGAIASRLWKIVGKVSAQDVADAFRDGFAGTVTSAPGFLVYGASLVSKNAPTDPDLVFFFNVFDTPQQAAAANAKAQAFVDGSILLKGQIEPFEFNSGGIIQFDFGPECNYQP